MYSLFVGDITPEVDDGMLYEFFYNRYPSCRGGKVVLDSMGNSKWVLCHHTRWRKYFANIHMYCWIPLLLPSSKCVSSGFVYMRKSRLTHFSSLHTMKVTRLWISAGREFQSVGAAVVAPFTLPFKCRNHAPILHIVFRVKVSDMARGEISLWLWCASGVGIRVTAEAKCTNVNG